MHLWTKTHWLTDYIIKESSQKLWKMRCTSELSITLGQYEEQWLAGACSTGRCQSKLLTNSTTIKQQRWPLENPQVWQSMRQTYLWTGSILDSWSLYINGQSTSWLTDTMSMLRWLTAQREKSGAGASTFVEFVNRPHFSTMAREMEVAWNNVDTFHIQKV